MESVHYLTLSEKKESHAPSFAPCLTKTGTHSSRGQRHRCRSRRLIKMCCSQARRRKVMALASTRPRAAAVVRTDGGATGECDELVGLQCIGDAYLPRPIYLSSGCSLRYPIPLHLQIINLPVCPFTRGLFQSPNRGSGSEEEGVQ